MIKKLTEWAQKVSENKTGLDKEMFNDLMKVVFERLEKEGYEKTFQYLQDNYVKGEGHRMVGVILLRNNSKQIKDKLWSLNR